MTEEEGQAHLDALREIAMGYPLKRGMTDQEYAQQYLDIAQHQKKALYSAEHLPQNRRAPVLDRK